LTSKFFLKTRCLLLIQHFFDKPVLVKNLIATQIRRTSAGDKRTKASITRVASVGGRRRHRIQHCRPLVTPANNAGRHNAGSAGTD